MSTTYHRTNYKADSANATINHVVATVSSMVSPTDSPTEFADEVEITLTYDDDDNLRVLGQIDRDPTGYELPEGYVEPEGNRYQQGFGERNLTEDQLRTHLKTREMYL